MAIELTVERIKALSKSKGFKMKFICGNIGVRDNYFTKCKAKNIDIPVDKLTAVVTMLNTTIERISEPFIVLGTVFVQTKRHSLP